LGETSGLLPRSNALVGPLHSSSILGSRSKLLVDCFSTCVGRFGYKDFGSTLSASGYDGLAQPFSASPLICSFTTSSPSILVVLRILVFFLFFLRLGERVPFLLVWLCIYVLRPYLASHTNVVEFSTNGGSSEPAGPSNACLDSSFPLPSLDKWIKAHPRFSSSLLTEAKTIYPLRLPSLFLYFGQRQFSRTWPDMSSSPSSETPRPFPLLGFRLFFSSVLVSRISRFSR